MTLTALQKSTAQAVVNIFETGSVRGDYAGVTLMRGDTGQLTYGRSQTTLASGNLYLLIKDYTAHKDGAYCASFEPYLNGLESCDSALNNDSKFRSLLKDAGEDPVMHEVQDSFFDRVYWEPAMRSAAVVGAQTALGCAIVYDSTVHGSWARIRDRVRKFFGELPAIGEKTWMGHYVDERRNWLATNSNSLLHKTVYRMDTFRDLIHAGNWDLKLPLTVRGFSITAQALSETPPLKVRADDGASRLLRLKSPPLKGADVVWLQERLSRAGFKVNSGVFDEATDKALKGFQTDHRLAPDGVVGPVTRAALEDLSVTVPAKRTSSDEPMPAAPAAAPASAQPAPAPTHTSTPMAHPSQTPKAPAPRPTASPSVPAPSADSSDPIDMIKRQVSAEIDELRQNLRDMQDNLKQRIVDRAKTEARGVIDDLEADVKARGRGVLRDAVNNGRPLIASAVSAVTLAFTEFRDTLVWPSTQSSTATAAAAAAPSTPPATLAAAPPPPPAAHGGDAIYQAYQYVHGLAQSLPSEWVFRLRVLALVLVGYALYRLAVRHVQARAVAKATGTTT